MLEYIFNIKSFADTSGTPTVTDSIFHTGSHVCGIIVEDCYYPYDYTQTVDIEFALANNLKLVRRCPEYLDLLMREFAGQHGLN